MDIYNIDFNEYSTPIKDLHLDELPDEVVENFYDAVNNIPFVKNMTSTKRLRARDLPRDDKGRIIVDIENPHILEDMDYFRPAAIHFEKTGRYSPFHESNNPASSYYKWFMEEKRRCYEGYVRESDGEWVTGDMYFMLNYSPMDIIKRVNGRTERSFGFARVWDGHYYKFHFIEKARNMGKHYIELASRGKGKTECGASMILKRFMLGESFGHNTDCNMYVIASNKKYLQNGDQILDKFQKNFNFLSQNTQFPRRTRKDAENNMRWKMGYFDNITRTWKGKSNEVNGISAHNDPEVARGTRGILYVLEEAGSFNHLKAMWANLMPSIGDNDATWGMCCAYGTASDDDSDFESMQEMMYHPEGYDIYSINNVFDKDGQGSKRFAFFFPAYMNLSGCYDSDGNSDVTKALIDIFVNRYNKKYKQTDLNVAMKTIAERPITPQEAIMRTNSNIFPTIALTERINQLENTEINDSHVGVLEWNNDNVVFRSTSDMPIREFPLKDSSHPGALEIWHMPVNDPQTKAPMPNRYIIGHDPVDSDVADNSVSLSSTFVIDTFTDEIVAEYTGRTSFAYDAYEIVRKLCHFYNAKCLYEKNIKGLYSYFSQKNDANRYLLDTPQILMDQGLVRDRGFGNTSKGVTASLPVNNWANRLIRDWLLRETVEIVKEGDDVIEKHVANLYKIKSKALLLELVKYNPDINVDRIRALGIAMIYREQIWKDCQGDPMTLSVRRKAQNVEDDKFFKSYDMMMDRVKKQRNYFY